MYNKYINLSYPKSCLWDLDSSKVRKDNKKRRCNGEKYALVVQAPHHESHRSEAQAPSLAAIRVFNRF